MLTGKNEEMRRRVQSQEKGFIVFSGNHGPCRHHNMRSEGPPAQIPNQSTDFT